MSFGKDPAARNSSGSFRQMSNQFTKPAGGRKKGSGVPYFIDQFQPPMGRSCYARLIPGEYLQDEVIGEGDNMEIVSVVMPFIKFTDHYDGAKQKGCICSAGPLANDKKRRDPCHGCDIYWETAVKNNQGRWESTRMSKQTKYVFSVFDYSPYHKISQTDDDGKVRTNSQGQAYFNWNRCDGQGCDACRAGAETKQGNASHWPMSYTQLQVLRAQDASIGRSCTVCGTPGTAGMPNGFDPITSLAWICGTPGCGAEVLDLSTTQLKRDEVMKLTEEKYNCGTCKQKNFLIEIFECGVCAQRGQQGSRASLWNVDLSVMLVPGVGKQKVLQVSGWSAPYPINPQFAEAKPVDLVTRYMPASLDTQAETFGLPMAGARQPVTGAQGAPPTRAYVNPYQTPQQ